MEEFTFDVKGIMYRPKGVIKSAAKNLKEGSVLELSRDKSNEFDDYAVKVAHDFTWIGYVDSGTSQQVAELIDSGKSFSCEVLFVGVDYDTDYTDTGREIEIINDIDILAKVTVE